MDLKLNNQDVIEVQAFRFSLRGFKKIWYLLFRNDSLFMQNASLSGAQKVLDNGLTSSLIVNWGLLPCSYEDRGDIKVSEGGHR